MMYKDEFIFGKTQGSNPQRLTTNQLNAPHLMYLLNTRTSGGPRPYNVVIPGFEQMLAMPVPPPPPPTTAMRLQSPSRTGKPGGNVQPLILENVGSLSTRCDNDNSSLLVSNNIVLTEPNKQSSRDFLLQNLKCSTQQRADAETSNRSDSKFSLPPKDCEFTQSNCKKGMASSLLRAILNRQAESTGRNKTSSSTGREQLMKCKDILYCKRTNPFLVPVNHKINERKSLIKVNRKQESSPCSITPAETQTPTNSNSDTEISHDNCEACPQSDHNYAKCVLSEQPSSLNSPNDISSESFKDVIYIDIDNEEEDSLLITKSLENFERVEEYSTSLKTSEKGEQVMVVNPNLDNIKELEIPQVKSHRPELFHSVLHTDNEKQSNEKTLQEDAIQTRPNFSGQSFEYLYNHLEHANPQYYASNSEDSLTNPKNSNVVEETDPSCDWKIESVYSLASESEDMNGKVISSVAESDETDEDETETFSIKESKWKEIFQPCFVVLERLSILKETKSQQSDILSKCSHHCRQRTLRFLCGMNLLKCNNHPVLENIEESFKKVNVFDQSNNSQPCITVDDGECTLQKSPVLHSVLSDTDNRADQTLKQNQTLEIHKDKAGERKSKVMTFEKELFQLSSQVEMKRRQMLRKKKMKSRKYSKNSSLPTIRGVPVDPVYFAKTCTFSVTNNSFKSLQKNGKNFEVCNNKGQNVLPRLNPSRPEESKSSHSNSSSASTNQTPYAKIPHKLYSVSNSGTQMRLIPSATNNPIPPYKLQTALKAITKYLQSNPEILSNKNYNYFMIKIDDQQVLIKTSSLTSKVANTSQPSEKDDASNASKVDNSKLALPPKSPNPKTTKGCSRRSGSDQSTVLDSRDSPVHYSNLKSNELEDVQITHSHIHQGKKITTLSSLKTPTDNSYEQIEKDLSFSKNAEKKTQIGEASSSSESSKVPASCSSSQTQVKTKRPLTLSQYSIEEQKRIKRKKLEAKYPLPPGVVIKSEPIMDGYDIDNNWTVTSEIPLGFISNTITPTAPIMQEIDDEAEGPLGGFSSIESSLHDLPPLLVEDTTDSFTSDNLLLMSSSDIASETPPFLQPMASQSSHKEAMVRPELTVINTSHKTNKMSNQQVVKKPGRSPESGYDSPCTSSSSSSETVTSSSSFLLSEPTTSSSSSTSLCHDGDVSRPKSSTANSRIQQLKELLRQKQMHVEKLCKVMSSMPQVDLDSI